MDFGTGLLPNTNVGDYLSWKGTPSTMSTFRKMYPKLRDQDVHLGIGCLHLLVGGWMARGLWFKEGHVEIIKEKNDHDPRWPRCLYPPKPSFPIIWKFGGDVPRFKRDGSMAWWFKNFRVYVVQTKRYFPATLPPVQVN